jgi:hypothetical protein
MFSEEFVQRQKMEVYERYADVMGGWVWGSLPEDAWVRDL